MSSGAALSRLALPLAVGLLAPAAQAQQGEENGNVLIDLWAQDRPAFGVFVPAEGGRGATGPRYTREIGEGLARNPLYDYVFLNLEGSWDPEAVRVIREGLRSPAATSRKALIVRIPSIEAAGADVTGARVKEAFDLGADGVTIPHVRSVDEARLATGFFTDASDDVWSPRNPGGQKLGMIMIEDPEALLQVAEIADLDGYSILACGIGSLSGAFRGGGIVAALVDLGFLTQEQAGQLGEAGARKVLDETKRVGRPNMLTASVQNVESRVADGYLALLMQGPTADEAIRIGRAAAGR